MAQTYLNRQKYARIQIIDYLYVEKIVYTKVFVFDTNSDRFRHGGKVPAVYHLLIF